MLVSAQECQFWQQMSARVIDSRCYDKDAAIFHSKDDRVRINCWQWKQMELQNIKLTVGYWLLKRTEYQRIVYRFSVEMNLLIIWFQFYVLLHLVSLMNISNYHKIIGKTRRTFRCKWCSTKNKDDFHLKTFGDR